MNRITITAGVGFTREGYRITEVTREPSLEHIRKALAERFGGFTEHNAIGGWNDGKGSYIEEPAKVWTIYSYDATPNDAWDAGDVVRLALRQDTVLVTYDSPAIHEATFVGCNNCDSEKSMA